MKIKIKKTIHYLILILLSITPLFCIVEIFDYLGISNYFDMFFIKISKDGLIAVIMLFSILYVLRNGFSRKCIILFFLFVVFTTVAFFNSFSNTMVAIAGIRWCCPFFLTYFLINIIDLNLMKKVSYVLSCLIVLQCILQIYEMFNMPAYDGSNYFGLSGRLPGYFVNPSAAGCFAGFVFFIVKYFSAFKLRLRRLILITSSASAFLAMSSTGVIILMFLWLYPLYLKSKNKIAISIVLLIVSFLAITNLDILTGRRSGSSETSFSTRVEIIVDQIRQSEFISSKFGSATNTAVNMQEQLEIDTDNAFISDSLYTSILTNYGWLFSIIFLLAVVLGIVTVLSKRRNKTLTQFLGITIMSSIPIITTELYPVNIFIVILGAYYLSNYSHIKLLKKQNLHTNEDTSLYLHY